MFESRVATTAQNALPTIFGCPKQGIDMTAHLTGIPTLKHWDAMEGMQGMVYKIKKELPNAQDQLYTTITIVLVDYSEDRQLFHELLTQSVRFLNVLILFMNNFFMRHQSTSNCSNDAAWSTLSKNKPEMSGMQMTLPSLAHTHHSLAILRDGEDNQ
eukprot:1831447-Ditylum_brightwellii.AAC.1